MKKLIFSLLLIVLFQFCYSQEVIVSSADTEKNNNLEIDYSVGQIFFQKKKWGTFNYSEGIFQTFKIGLFNNVIEFTTKVYPNPNKGVFYISLDGGFTDLDVISYNITNLAGQFIGEGKMKENPFKIDISSLSSGVYLIHLYTNYGKNKTVKIIKD
tara:strand:+ start:431 stop:898 length:468 start_codon:yes stop_codon:yes gene_type:complete